MEGRNIRLLYLHDLSYFLHQLRRKRRASVRQELMWAAKTADDTVEKFPSRYFCIIGLYRNGFDPSG
jgi:hypothetical protein